MPRANKITPPKNMAHNKNYKPEAEKKPVKKAKKKK
tara:strand:+ start:473 stop:580 length:108 start_codon:yes stop_codon:yes gene_type:complete